MEKYEGRKPKGFRWVEERTCIKCEHAFETNFWRLQPFKIWVCKKYMFEFSCYNEACSWVCDEFKEKDID